MSPHYLLTMPYRAFLTVLVTLVAPGVFIREAVYSEPEEALMVLRNAYIEIWS